MEKIIDGKLYNTENAELLCKFCYSNPIDFEHVEELLYKSPNGQFFIEYSGGPQSKYAKRYGQSEVGGSSGS